MRVFVILVAVSCLAAPALAGEKDSRRSLTSTGVSAFVPSCAVEGLTIEQHASRCDSVSAQLDFFAAGKSGGRSLKLNGRWPEALWEASPAESGETP